jgi:hypothetical protein
MAREKDKSLADGCRRMAAASRDALAWIDDNRERVGVGIEGVRRSLKKHAVEARKLAAAAERPMSVGVFGASQAGKSFLIGALIAPADRPARVVFGAGEGARRLSFLEEVNPQGGDETTGLVTRFSLSPHDTPPGHEVALRLLGEIDVVKILANTYLFDLSAEPAEGQPAIADLIESGARAADEAPVDTLVVEDVFALREYFEKSLYRHPMARDEGSRYWTFIEDYLPRLRPDQRAKALAPLWGGYERLTALYSRLKGALDQLGQPEWAYAPLPAVTDRAGGILHVGTLYGLDRESAGEGGPGGAPVMVAVKSGPTVALPKPVVTALTAELRVTLDAAPWKFFETTDLLDFPGARSRLESSAREWLDPQKKEDGRAQCFLRGKVAVLFDKYAAELDLNTMLLCVGPENQEVRKLPELVEGWIGETHGKTPREREGRRVSLFMCLTKADRLFDVSAGSAPEQSVRNRLANNFNFYPGWTTEWSPGRAFSNTHLIRNPNFTREDLFDYEAPAGSGETEGVPAELKVREDKVAWLGTYRSAFMAEPLVRDFFAEPEAIWQAMLALNDGGISHLAGRLVPVCDPDLKYGQIKPRAEALEGRLKAELAVWHEEGDLDKRLAERLAKAKAIRAALARNPSLIGRFMNELMVDTAAVGQRYLDYLRRARGADRGSIDLGPLGGENEGAAPAGGHELGDEVLELWFGELNRKTADEALAAACGLAPAQFQTVVEELRVAARRLGLSGRIGRAYEEMPRADLPAELVHRVGLAAALLVNGLVRHLGQQPPPAAEAPAAPPARAAAAGDTLVVRRSTSALPPGLDADPAVMRRVRGRMPGAWLEALVALAQENAAWSEGGFVDPAQNARLGALIAAVEGASR